MSYQTPRRAVFRQSLGVAALALMASLALHVSAWLSLADIKFKLPFAVEQKATDVLSTRLILPAQASPNQSTAAPSAPPASVSPAIQQKSPIPTPAPSRAQSARPLPVTTTPQPMSTPTLANVSSHEIAQTIASSNTQVTLSSMDPKASLLQLPSNAHWIYDVSYNTGASKNSGVGKLTWLIDATGYQIILEAAMQDGRRFLQTSKGILTPQGLRPTKFEQDITGQDRVELDFLQLNAAQLKKEPGVELDFATLQDPLSSLMQASLTINSDPQRYKIVNRIPLHTTDGQSIQSELLMFDGFRDISVRLMNLQVLLARRQAHGIASLPIEIGLAQQNQFLPAYLKISVEPGSPQNNFLFSLEKIELASPINQ